MTHYEFGIRFRDADETEGSGSLLFRVRVHDTYLTHAIRRTMTDLTTQYPAVVFDGMIFYGTIETS